MRHAGFRGQGYRFGEHCHVWAEWLSALHTWSEIKSRGHTEKPENKYNSSLGDCPLGYVKKKATKFKETSVLGRDCKASTIWFKTWFMNVHENTIESLSAIVKVVRLEVESRLREAI